MFKNKIYLSFTFVLLLSIWGCGTMAKEDDSLSVPQKVSIAMPKALEVESSKNEKSLKLNKEDTKKSAAYLELKDDIEFLEEQRVELEVNLLFINEVISTIDNQCKGLAIEEPCIMEEESLSFLFDEELSRKLRLLTQKESEYELGDTLSFGEVEFIEHGSSNIYRYTLNMDTTFDDENSTSSIGISWSKDEKIILAEYEEESDEEESSLQVEFLEEDDSRRMIVEDGLFSKEDDSFDIFYFDMLAKSDVNETYELNSSSIDVDSDGEEENVTSVGQLSNLGGYLNFIGELDAETFKENDTFDGDGNILTSSYCYSGMDCDLEDEESWFDF
jgi:hypothetical protein